MEEVAPTRLVEKFSRSSDTPPEHENARTTEPNSDSASLAVEREGQTVTVAVGDETVSIPVEAVDELQDALDDARTERRTFLHTVGEHRQDGSYVVERKGADSAGNSKVFDSFDTLERLVDRLPEAVVAEDLSRVGLTGGRRHMVLWHLIEDPQFPFELASRQPLTARKEGDE